MPISDKNIQWKRKKLWIDQRDMGRIRDGTDGMFSVGSGNPIESVVTGKAISGLLQASAGDTQSFFLSVPYDLDPRSEMGVTVHWTTGDDTAADYVTWIVTYSAIKENVVIPASGSALDTAITTQDTTEGALFWQKTSRGIIDADTLSILSDDPEQVGLRFFVEADALSGIGSGLWLLGVELDYYPAMTDNTLARHAKRVNVA